ncbi:MAG: radical family heme chaperone HemW [Bacteroidota bacterium]|jgi:oxygen-independent coproporphyrinogen-3 oxidase
MAGIYLHIPFCKQACHYCNFHFSTSLKYKTGMIGAMLREIELQVPYLEGEAIETIYLGGGTPSLLDQAELNLLFDKIHRHFTMAEGPVEITLEANPDDLHVEKIKQLRQTPVNRLSIGIQSFEDEELMRMNRAHCSAEALAAIQLARDAGFENLTVDLIYGSPTTSDDQWAANLQQVFDLEIPHLSCYCLTVEEKTALWHFVKSGKAAPVDEEHAARQFDYLVNTTGLHGYEQYEISNFARQGWYSRHNSNYWKGAKYLGIGPSAHSFNGRSRQWNVANNAQYIKALQSGQLPFELEVLTAEQRYNEYVMTSLRTSWGCDLKQIRELGFEAYFLKIIHPFIQQQFVHQQGDFFYLTKKGKFLADGIASSLFLI